MPEPTRMAPPADPSPTGAAPPAIVSQLADVAAIRRVLPGYVAGLAGHVGLMLGHQAAGRRAELRRLAHQLRGSGGAYGFPDVTDLAATVESDLDAGVAQGALAAHVAALVDLVRRIDGYDPAGEAGPAAPVRAAAA